MARRRWTTSPRDIDDFDQGHSIIGRNSFHLPLPEAVKLLRSIVDVYEDA